MSSKNKQIAGVCGGLAESFDIEPLLVRLTFFVLIFINGIGLIIYLILLMILPRESEVVPKEIVVDPEDEAGKKRKLSRYNKGKMIAGICTGLEKYFGIDVSIIRVVFATATILTGGFGIILYILLWAILPVEY